MAIARCNKCGTLAEYGLDLINTTQSCAHCATEITVYDTRFFVGRLLEQFFAMRAELLQFKADTPSTPKADSAQTTLPLDLHNTDFFSSEAQHRAIVDWLRSRNIAATINPCAVDTTGFFDEAAVAIGADRKVLGHVCERIRFAQLKEFNSTTIHLEKRSDDEVAAIEAFAWKLHHWSLVSKTFVNRPEKNIRLILQSAPSVRHFFAGEWLEWFVLMTVLRLCKERGIEFSCARRLTLSLQGDETRELDVFFLIKDREPIYVECKTGEFRQDLAKYVALRKRLQIDARHFILCVADMDPDQAKALRAMYDMTFVNTETLGAHVSTLI